MHGQVMTGPWTGPIDKRRPEERRRRDVMIDDPRRVMRSGPEMNRLPPRTPGMQGHDGGAVGDVSPSPAARCGGRILVADADHEARLWVRTIAGERFVVDDVDTGAAALDRIASGATRIVIVGRGLADMTGAELLDRAAPWRAPGRAAFLLADRAGESPDVDETRIPVFYRLLRDMAPPRVLELLARAAAELPPLPPDDPDPAFAAVVAGHARAIGRAAEPDDAARAAAAAVIELVGADRARCLYCSEASGRVWSGSEADDSEFSASAGIVGFAVRSATGVVVPRAGDDALYRAEIDDPGGTGRERLAIQPVTGLDGHVHAVLVAIRDEARPAFTQAELDQLAALASAWSPYLMLLAMRVDADRILGDRLDRGRPHMFRSEAMESVARRGQGGDVVRIHPGWVGAAFWVVLGSLAAAILYAALTQVREYAAGAAVIRHADHREVFSQEAGTVAWLAAVPGQHVEGGQVLARLDDAAQVDRLRALEAELERKLAGRSPSPDGPGTAQSVEAVRSQLDRARLDLASRAIRAPRAGIVKEVRVRDGQRVEPGTAVLSLIDTTHEELKVIAFLPGDERPRLRVHQPVHLVLPGYRGTHITSEVSAISEVLAAGDARARFLGDRRDERLPLPGAIAVVVEARLASPEFEADGERLQLYEGMVGLAEVELRSRSLLESLIPGVR
jgi:hypothetical protein